jgi:hypothetical protein
LSYLMVRVHDMDFSWVSARCNTLHLIRISESGNILLLLTSLTIAASIPGLLHLY